jgi:hypothetical protein
VVCACGNGCQFSREGVDNRLQPGFACVAAKGGIWHGRVAVLAFVLVVAFLSSHLEATTSLALPVSDYRSGRCTTVSSRPKAPGRGRQSILTSPQG